MEAAERLVGGTVQVGCFLPHRVLMVCRSNTVLAMPDTVEVAA